MVLMPSLHMEGFKGFSSLHIEKLGRVNLIVGKNNAGKTSLLEALYLYAVQGSPNSVIQVLWNRHEIRSWLSRKKDEPLPDDPNPAAFSRLFHGCYSIEDITFPIRIGPIGSKDETLTMEFLWGDLDVDERGQVLIPLAETLSDKRPVLDISLGTVQRGRIFLDLVWNPEYRRILRSRWVRRDIKANPVMVPPSGFDDEHLGWLWDSIAATDLEEAAIDALRLIDSRVERLYFVRDEKKAYDRTAVLKLKDIPVQVPLRNLGDGMNRVLGIVLAVAKSKGSAVFIDEIENGIHYSVQADFLKLLFRVANQMDVQVFATTHSWDCIEAFQAAAEADHQEGYLVRLARRDTAVEATVFDEQLLSVVTRQDIEVR